MISARSASRVLLSSLLLCVATAAHASLLTLPDARYNTEKGETAVGFFNDERSQWLYGADLFTGGPITITGLQLRQAVGWAGSGTFAAELRIVLSATGVSPLQGTDLDGNYGPADKTEEVLKKPVTFGYASGADPSGSAPNAWADVISFTTPFLYDPSSGLGLLIDFLVGPYSVIQQFRPDRTQGVDGTESVRGGSGATISQDAMIIRLTVSNVPEPTTLALFALGLLSAGVAQRRRIAA